MKLLIIKPRLDISFKETYFFPTHPTYNKFQLPPIRQHWWEYVKYLKMCLIERGHEVFEDHIPMWYINDRSRMLEYSRSYDKVFVPHREAKDYPTIENFVFYMQTVFPSEFTLDVKGWGSNLSFLKDLKPEEKELDSNILDFLNNNIKSGFSKFEQPEMTDFPNKDYWLFVCQIPHDETIKRHSSVSVEDALLKTCFLAKKHGKKLYVKGHPVNKHSMKPLMKISKENDAIYVDDVNIHSILKNAETVFMVNSGVGFEAILHEKPVVIFGNAEYSGVVQTYDDNMAFPIRINTQLYKNFICRYYDSLVMDTALSRLGF